MKKNIFSLQHDIAYKSDFAGNTPHGTQIKGMQKGDKVSLNWDWIKKVENSEHDYYFNFDCFVLYDDAKVSDVISPFDSLGMLVSPKLRKILESYKMPKGNFFEIKIRHKSTVYDYYWLHLNTSFYEIIDFCETVFVHKQSKVENGVYVTNCVKEYVFQNQKDLKMAQSDLFKDIDGLNRIDLKSCCFKEEFDIFLYGSIYFCSERLKNCFEKNEISGLRFEESWFDAKFKDIE
jgi:hypothetical protein